MNKLTWIFQNHLVVAGSALVLPRFMLAGLVLLSLPACGAVAEEQLESNTNWLARCSSDGDCSGGLGCACGVCTRTCEAARCPSALACAESDSCGESAPQACLATCSDDTECAYLDTSAACVDGVCAADGAGFSQRVVNQTRPGPVPSSSGSAALSDAGATDCNGPGHYEVGKEGNYLVCCEGLTEVPQLSPAYSDDTQVCTDLPLRVFACVAGSCGDGICEVGEDVSCGCTLDCPGAVWEDVDAGVVTDGGATSATCRVAYVEYEVGESLPGPDCVSCRCGVGGEPECDSADADCPWAGPVLPCEEMFPNLMPADYPGDLITVQSSAIDGDTLLLEAFHGGGCERHDYALCFGPFLESNPVQVELRLIHDAHGDACEAGIAPQLQFDLTPLKEAHGQAYQVETGTILTTYGPYEYE